MDQYIGQIEIFAFGFPPRGWVACTGQTMSIQQNQALYSLLGTTYGGNGQTTFNLPDLRSRLAMTQGNGPGLSPRVLGQVGGEENHTLVLAETPMHNHAVGVAPNVTVSTNTFTPSNTVVLAQTTGQQGGTVMTVNLYVADANPNQVMASTSIGNTGGQPHNNLMPYLALNFCISLVGAFPSRN